MQNPAPAYQNRLSLSTIFFNLEELGKVESRSLRQIHAPETA